LQARFATFTFDDATRELRCGDRFVHLSPKAFDLLGLLLRRRPNAVSKADLHRGLWPDTFVSDGSLAVLAAEVRRAVGDSARRPQFVRTINRFGYAFVGAAVDAVADGAPAGRAAGACWLTWGSERARLKPGENVLGRDPDADVYIDAIGVSRRHAAIVVVYSGVMLQDLSSKNGTFANGNRVTWSVPLFDDTEIRLGALCLRFRRPGRAGPTQTVGGSQDLLGSS
jgi:DNA-binding winged helix-turn-helix (wHTH) protein